MIKRIRLFAGLFPLMILFGLNYAGDMDSMQGTPFPVAKVHFEQNATDGDMEVVFEVIGEKNGLARLMVAAPNGRPVIDFSAPDSGTLGIRQFGFESPEPGNVELLKSAYPEGIYTFAGSDVNGAKFYGTHSLYHRLPDTTTFIQPTRNAQKVPIEGLQIVWKAINKIKAYIVYIENNEINVNISTHLAARTTSFAVPEGFLGPDIKYTLGIGTVNEDGNISFIETSFTTAGMH